MSTAFYPLGMKSYNNHLPQGGYTSWKGSGIFSNPVGISNSHIRPLTNNDIRNNFPTGFGLARPIKHYRKGRVTPILLVNPNNENNYIESYKVNPNLNRIVKSSYGASLGGGAGGRGLLNEMQDNPGSFIIKQNSNNEVNNNEYLDENCKTCEGVGIISSYYPNTTYLTDNPEQNTQTPKFCCNEERKAKRRAIYASTNLKKNYYTTNKEYLQNRCKTYEQKVFNFQKPNPIQVQAIINNTNITLKEIVNAKPGSALATLNTYFANCYPNAEIYNATENALVKNFLYILLNKSLITREEYDEFINDINLSFNTLINIINNFSEENKQYANELFISFINNPYYGVPLSGPSNQVGCKLTVYKPNNPQYAVQGAVSSSTRILKLNVDTITTNAAYLNSNFVTNGKTNIDSFIMKNKAPPCNPSTQVPFQNKKFCNLGSKYNLNTKPYQPPFNSNHFAQSPRIVL